MNGEELFDDEGGVDGEERERQTHQRVVLGRAHAPMLVKDSEDLTSCQQRRRMVRPCIACACVTNACVRSSCAQCGAEHYYR